MLATGKNSLWVKGICETGISGNDESLTSCSVIVVIIVDMSNYA